VPARESLWGRRRRVGLVLMTSGWPQSCFIQCWYARPRIAMYHYFFTGRPAW